jgi:hypothetical protein
LQQTAELVGFVSLKKLFGFKNMREVILEIGAEGGSLTLYGTRGSDGLRKYHLVTNSVALHDLLLDESFDEDPVTQSPTVTSWRQAILLLEKYPSWYRFYPISVLPEFASRVLQAVESSGGVEAASRWRKKLNLPAFSTSKIQNSSRLVGVSGPISLDKIRTLYKRYLELVSLETGQFGVEPTEVRHLIGRLGEFYCALAVSGALASNANQHGFDVIASSGSRVSVKTTAQKSGFVPISAATAGLADELMILQYRAETLSVIFYGNIQDALDAARHYPEKGKYELGIALAQSLASKPLA